MPRLFSEGSFKGGYNKIPLSMGGGKITKDRKKMELYKEESKLYGKGWVRDAVVTTGDKKCCGSESPSQQLCIRALFVH